MRIHKLALACLCFSSFLASTAQVKLEKVGALTAAAVPVSVRNVLDAGGERVLRADGTPLCDIWLRKVLSAASGPAAKDVVYPDFSQSEMVGVISLLKMGKDFRGQPIKPGYYTLRYELLPDDGNHLGVAPNRDFLLLLPAAADPDPNTRYDFAKMVQLSAQAAGGNHPAAFAMLGPEAGELPRAFENADSFTVFAASLKLDSGKSVRFALVVKGEAAQ